MLVPLSFRGEARAPIKAHHYWTNHSRSLSLSGLGSPDVHREGGVKRRW